jgi:hypothetical protein
MARAIAEIEEEIRALSTEEKRELLRTLIAELDAPSDPVEREWLNAAQRRYGEIAEGRPGRAGATGIQAASLPTWLRILAGEARSLATRQ